MSLLLKTDGQVLINSFSPRTDWLECRRFLEQRGLLASRDTRSHEPAAVPDNTRSFKPDPIKLARVDSVWENATPPLKTLAATYLDNRGLKGTHENSKALRYADKCDHRPYGSKYPPFRFSPALLAEVTDNSETRVGLHITYLDPKTGYRRLDDPTRKIIGSMRGGAIRLHIAQDTLLVAEGIETALSAGRRFRAPAWSLLSAVNMAKWEPPTGVRKLLIAGDSNQAGQDAAFELARRAAPPVSRPCPSSCRMSSPTGMNTTLGVDNFMTEDTTSCEFIDSQPPTRRTDEVTSAPGKRSAMSNSSQRDAARYRDYARRRKEEGYRHVRALLSPDQLAVLDRIANGRPRAVVLADLLAEKAAELREQEREGA